MSMASLIRFPNNPIFSSSSLSSSSSNRYVNGGKIRMSVLIHPRRQLLLQTSFHPTPPDLVKERENQSLVLGFSGFGVGKKRGKNKVWGSEEDGDLEEEVLEFMKTARDRDSFPTKEELIIGGRLDLVKRIMKQGGWLAFGWDLDDGEDEDDEDEEEKGVEALEAVDEVKGKFLKDDSRIFQNRFDTLKESEAADSSGNSSSLHINGSHQPSSSGRVEGEEDAGIGGILSRLQKERFQSSFPVGAMSKESKVHGSGNGGDKEMTMGIIQDTGEVRGVTSHYLFCGVSGD